MKLLRLFPALFLCAAHFAHAFTSADLGQGLTYVRPAADELLGPELQNFPAAVIDLRELDLKAPQTTALFSTLATQAQLNPRPLRLLLLNESASRSIRDSLKQQPLPGGVLTLAPASVKFPADLTLAVSDKEEKALREAFEKNTPITELLPAPTVKERRDEASLVQEHTNGATLPEPTESAPAKKTETPAEPVIDHLLQRALQIHRAQIALGKP